ncbi:MAG TPA: biopolymer transporter ExbD [Verrucomicrobiae bacterium]|jgi:biopolymer transport protein ExbD
MKFPRNTRLLRSPFEVAPFAAVFFLFAMFLMFAALMPTPGIPLQLPVAAGLPGIDQPTVSVAVDSSGRYFYANQLVNDFQLKSGLMTAVKTTGPRLTLVIHADKSVTYDQLVHLTMLAHGAGIHSALLATMPRPEETGRP